MRSAFAALFLVLMFWKSRINPTVPLMTVAAFMLIRRAMRAPAEASQSIRIPDPIHTLAA